MRLLKNKKGFTLTELLATLVVLSIVIGITIVAVNFSYKKTVSKTEDIFIKTLRDALEMYISSDGKKLSYQDTGKCIVKTYNKAKLYKNTNVIKFSDIINSTYVPLVASEVINPANKDVECNLDAFVNIYYDDDYVYYYEMDKANFGCLTTDGSINNLPTLSTNCN